MTFGDRLKEERKRLGITGQEMAEIGGVKRTAQFRYETNLTKPTYEYLVRVVAEGADLSYLLFANRNPDVVVVSEIPDELLPEVFEMIDFFCRDRDGKSLDSGTKASLFRAIREMLSRDPQILKSPNKWRAKTLTAFENLDGE